MPGLMWLESSSRSWKTKPCLRRRVFSHPSPLVHNQTLEDSVMWSFYCVLVFRCSSTYIHTFTCIRYLFRFNCIWWRVSTFTCAHFLKSLRAGLCRIWRTFLLLTLHVVDLPAKYLLWKPFNLSDLDLFLFLPSVSFMSGRRHPSLTLLPSFLWWTLLGIWHRAPWCPSQI